MRITEAKRGSFCRGEVIRVLRADPRSGGGAVPALPPRRLRRLRLPARRCRAATASSRPPWSPSSSAGWPDSSSTSTVEPLPGNGFGWRTRVRWALDPAGRIGPRGVRSHRVEGVNQAEPCLIAVPELTALAGAVDVPTGIRGPVRHRRTRGAGHRPAGGRGANRGEGALPEVALTRAADGATTATWIGLPSAPRAEATAVITERAIGRDFAVAADGFWQPHVDAADVLASAVGRRPRRFRSGRPDRLGPLRRGRAVRRGVVPHGGSGRRRGVRRIRRTGRRTRRRRISPTTRRRRSGSARSSTCWNN